MIGKSSETVTLRQRFDCIQETVMEKSEEKVLFY